MEAVALGAVALGEVALGEVAIALTGRSVLRARGGRTPMDHRVVPVAKGIDLCSRHLRVVPAVRVALAGLVREVVSAEALADRAGRAGWR